MKGKRVDRPFALWLLIILTFFMGIAASVSGPMLFLAPDGHLMQWSTDMLQGTPFPDFLVPGLILFTFLGLFSAFAAFGLVTRSAWNGPDVLNPWKALHWSWAASLAVGIVILTWIGVETLLFGYISFLQPVIAVWGTVILTLTLLPGVKQHYKLKATAG